MIILLKKKKAKKINTEICFWLLIEIIWEITMES